MSLAAIVAILAATAGIALLTLWARTDLTQHHEDDDEERE